MPTTTRVLGALAALAGLVAFTCHVAVPVDTGRGTGTLVDLSSVFDSVGIVAQVLLLAALGLAAARRPTIGARTVALGGLALPWLAPLVPRLWTDGYPTASRVLAGGVLVGMVVVAAAVVVAIREVRWGTGGVLLGDGVAVVVTGLVLWGLLGTNWYRVRDLSSDTLFDARFGAVLRASTAAGRVGWAATAVAVVAVGVAVSGGGWGRRLAGAVVAGTCGFEVLRRVFLSGERAFSPLEQANPFGATLSAEPVLGLLVVPLVGVAAGAWFLTTEGEAPADSDSDVDLDTGGEVEPAQPA